MSTRFGIDDVRGEVIGYVTPVQGVLLYGGRPQGSPVWGKSDREVKSILTARMDALKHKHAGICYNTGEKWEIQYRG